MKTLLLLILLLSFGQVQAYMNEQELTYTYLGIEYDCVFYSKHAEPPIYADFKDYFECGSWDLNPFDSVFRETLEFTAIFYVIDDQVTYFD